MANVTEDTLSLVKKAQGESVDAIAKSVTTASGLVAYDLQAPAKNLYPVLTPIRNKVPRVGGGKGLATNWRQVSAILGSGYDAMAWVPEGQRSGRMSYTTATKSASFVTLGEEDSITFEARNAGRGFEDVQASLAIRLLQKMMLKEEAAILFGNYDVALGTTPTPTTAAGGTGGTIGTLTYDVICMALTGEGYGSWKAAGSSLTAGIVQSKTVTGADGKTFVLSGGCAQPSATATQAITSGENLSASVTAVKGAVAYAWYVGGSGAAKLEAVTTINSVKLSALAGTGQAASGLTAADKSTNDSAFNGLFPWAAKAGSGAYYKALATGTAGTGTGLTTTGRGSIVEVDAMLQGMWDSYQVSPSIIFANSQEIQNMTKKALADSGTGALLRMSTDPASGARAIAAGGGIEWYYNPFSSIPGGQKIPVLIHPQLPPGTIVGWADNLPAQYQSSEVPNCVEVLTRQDYYQINWPQVTRAQDIGVYSEEVLAVYAPFCLGVITNIANS